LYRLFFDHPSENIYFLLFTETFIIICHLIIAHDFKKRGEVKMEIEYKISGMSCKHCVLAVKKELSKIGLDSFEVEIGSVKANFDEKKTAPALIENAITEAGFSLIK